jgi:hypothetical protein
MEKDREWKEKYNLLQKVSEKEAKELKAKLESALNDKQVISKNYESQLKMVSEHIVDLNSQNEKYEKEIKEFKKGGR